MENKTSTTSVHLEDDATVHTMPNRYLCALQIFLNQKKTVPPASPDCLSRDAIGFPTAGRTSALRVLSQSVTQTSWMALVASISHCLHARLVEIMSRFQSVAAQATRSRNCAHFSKLRGPRRAGRESTSGYESTFTKRGKVRKKTLTRLICLFMNTSWNVRKRG